LITLIGRIWGGGSWQAAAGDGRCVTPRCARLVDLSAPCARLAVEPSQRRDGVRLFGHGGTIVQFTRWRMLPDHDVVFATTANGGLGGRCRDRAHWSPAVNVRTAVGIGIGFAAHLPVVAALAMAYYNRLPFDLDGHGISGLIMVAMLGELILAVACAGTGGVLLGVERRVGLGAGLLIGWAAGLPAYPAVACALLAVWP